MSRSKPRFRFLDNSACLRALTPWSVLVESLSDAMADLTNGKIRQPVRAFLKVPDHGGHAGMMPCYSVSEGGLACKLLYLLPENISKYGLPTHYVYVMTFDPDTGSVKTLMEGEGITERRTAAASAMASKCLIRKDPRRISSLALLGTGRQGLSHVQALLSQYPNVSSLNVWNRTHSRAKLFLEEVSGWLPDVVISIFKDVDDCVKDADIVVVATFAKDPVLLKSHVVRERGDPPPLVLGVGACSPEHCELDPELMRSSHVVVDSAEAARVESGDVIRSRCHVAAEIGHIVKHGLHGVDPMKPIVFKSLGQAVQDLVAAKLVNGKIDKDEPIIEELPATHWDASRVQKASEQSQACAAETLHSQVDGDKHRLVVTASFSRGQGGDRDLLVFRAKTAVGGGAGLVLDASNGRLLGLADLPPGRAEDGDEEVRALVQLTRADSS